MRLFTLEEARALLPEVRQICTAMRAGKARLDMATEAARSAGNRAPRNGHGGGEAYSALTGAERTAREIQTQIDRLAQMGVEVKGIDQGLVDFPHERDGRTVYLCWQLGEDDIADWHDLHTGFAGRQPL